jgi:hypothetical protein
LYVLVPDDGETIPEYVVSAAKHVILFADGAWNIEFEGLRIQCAQGSVIVMQSGEAHSITISNSRVQYGGDSAIMLAGSSLTVSTNTVTNTGCSGVHVTGGDRTQLVSSQNTVTHSFISNYSLWKRTNRPGVKFNGVGVHVAGNEVFYAPHQAINGVGNNHLIENNYVMYALMYGIAAPFKWDSRGVTVGILFVIICLKYTQSDCHGVRRSSRLGSIFG